VAKIALIVGLGNPGAEYERTRHNAGFWFVDALTHGELRKEARFHGLCGDLQIGSQSCRLLEPQTFMNRSGRAVAAMIGYYRLGVDDILVVHDEIDLPPGVVRFKRGGGHGGHNGLRDIIAALGGNKDFLRLRLGVGRPVNRDQVIDYVLHKPSKGEQVSIDHAIADAMDVLPFAVDGDLDRAMHRLHSAE